MQVFTMELNLLARWAARRALELQSNVDANPPMKDDTLCLLPSYGFALHFIRRAAPFAALGIATTLSFPESVRVDAERVANAVALALQLQSSVRISRSTSAELVTTFARNSRRVILTGKRSTLQSIRSSHMGLKLFAATGTCTLLLGSNRNHLVAVADNLRLASLTPSCSNVANPVIVDLPLNPDGRGAQIGANLQPREKLREIIRVLHPTNILIADPDSTCPNEAKTLMGFRLGDCDSHGAANILDGGCRDPEGGWVGDYVI